MSKKDTGSQLEKQTNSEVALQERRPSHRTYSPSVDIVESQDELTIYADMPGVSADNIDIHFENGELTIFGRVVHRPSGSEQYLLREYGVGDFFRAFTISEAINAEGITADCSNGVLTLHLPKVEAVKPRKIQVKAGR
jgi:HSP20 family protein